MKDATNQSGGVLPRPAATSLSRRIMLQEVISVGGSNRAKAIKEPKVKAWQQIETPESQTLQQVLIHDKHLIVDFNVLAIS